MFLHQSDSDFKLKEGLSPRSGRLWDLRRCTMTPIISAAPTSTTASTEKLVMAASFHTSGVTSTDLPVKEHITVQIQT